MKTYKLTMPQKSVYDLESYGGEALATIGGVFFFDGRLNQQLMTQAINLMIKSNEAYRLKFLNTDDGIVQYIDDYSPEEFKTKHFVTEEEYKEWIEGYARCPIKENNGLYEFIMIILDNRFGVVIRANHKISDDWGTFLCKKLIMKNYTDLLNNRSVDLSNQYSYKSFIESEEEYYQSNKFLNDREYWNNVLRGDIIPTHITQKASKELTTARKIIVADKETRNMVRDYCSEKNVTEFTLLFTAFSILTYSRTRQKDIYVITTLANRISKADKNSLGMYVNTIPVHFNLDETICSRDYVKSVTASIRDTFRHRKYNYNLILEDAYNNNSISNKISDVYFSFLNTGNNKEDTELFFETFHSGVQVENLNFIARINAEQKLEFNYYYHTDIFQEWEIEILNESYTNILRNIISNDLSPISEILVLDEGKHDMVINTSNATDYEYPSHKNIIDLFEEQVNKNPDNIAVVFENDSLTYQELNEKSNALAHMLGDLDVNPDDFVAIIAQRSSEIIIGIIGTLKSGAAYVPVDPAYPQERIDYILEDCKPKVVMTYNVDNINVSGYEIIDLSDKSVFEGNMDNPLHINKPNDLAYVIYTSGTTGKPKGVMVQHSSVVNFCSDSDKNVMHYALKNGYKRIACVTNISFDIFVTETLLVFLNGMTTFIANRYEQDDAKSFSNYVIRNDIQILQTTPSRIRILMSDGNKSEGLRKLKFILIGGEKVEENLIYSLKEYTDATIANVYGPAETTVWSTIAIIESDKISDGITIGKPISNTKIYIVSIDGLCGVGYTGEICISGNGLARGYLNKPDLTDSKFVVNPYGEGKLYKTGDLARWLPDGNIEFLGRADTQVKIRGFRIELGEIESVLREVDYVKDAVVIARENSAGDKELNGYIVSEDKVDIMQIQNEIRKKLPEYMVPGYMMQINKIPVNRNGKLDQKMFPEIIMNSTNEYISPRNNIESDIAFIFEEVLSINKVGVTDSFFELGGDSIKATLVVSKADKKGYTLNVINILALKTVENISCFIQTNELLKVEETEPISTENIQLNEDYEKMYSLTPVQQGILYHYNNETSVGEYFMQSVIRSSATLNPFYIIKALQLLAIKHEVLRTKIIYNEGKESLQAISRDIEIECDLKSINSETEIEELCNKDIDRGFDFSTDSLMRVSVVAVNNENRFLIWSIHHIISDGWSNSIFFKDFNAIYNKLVEGEKYSELRSLIQSEEQNTSHFCDYVNFLETIDNNKSKEYWCDVLADYEGNCEIVSVDDVNSDEEIFGVAYKAIDSDLSNKLVEASKMLGVTLNTIYEAAFGVLLQKYTGISDVVFGKVVSGRNGEIANIENIAGIFINIVPVRISLDNEGTLKQLVTNVLEQFYTSLQYSYCSIADIQSATKQNGNLIKVLFAFENYYGNEEFSQREDYEFIKNREQTNYDLTATVKISNIITLEVMYNRKKYSARDGELLVERFYNILRSFAKDINIKSKDVTLGITEKELNEVIIPYNETAEYLPNTTLHGLFTQQVQKTPNNIAIICYDQEITYKQLFCRSCQVANYILSTGIEPKSNIAVLGERTIETVINILGVLMAGCSYVPLNPEYPEERNNYIVSNSNTKLCLSSKLFTDVNIDSFSAMMNGSYSSYCDCAYTIYTSGSTGVPKGVVIEHGAAVNTILDINNKFKITSQDRIIGLSSFSFDLSVYDIFGSLSTGATLVMVKDQRNVTDIKKIVMENEVTFWNSVPAIMSMFIDDTDKMFVNTSVRNVLFSGDLIPLNLPEAVLDLFPCAKVTSLGGATEASIWSIYYPIRKVNKRWRSIPYGKPLANQNMFILDSNLNMCPIGISGQICIGGKGVALGYANDSQKTNKSFINHKDFGRIYLTGDLGRMRNDSNIEFLGRMDDQVKIRGFRIELGEIENIIRDIDYIRDAVVVARNMDDGNKELNAYFVSDKEVDTSQIQQEIRKKLPEYMVPGYIMQIKEIPVTGNGKVDKNALPEPEYTNAKDYVAPRNSTEAAVVKAFEEILGVEIVSVTDSFFDLGGHSLKATKLRNVIEKATGVNIQLKDIFASSTPELLAEKIKFADEDEYKEITKIEKAPKYKMSSAQKRLFLLDEMMGSNISYNISSVLKIKGELDLKRLQEALNKLVKREEIFRTSFHMEEGEPVQKIEENAEIKIDYSEEEKVNIQETFNKFVSPFDLSKAPLMRVKVIKTEEEYIFFCDIHHIISDGESMLVMLGILSKLYIEKELVNPKVQYKDFTAWQNKKDIKKQAEYWKNEFAEEISILDLKTDFVRPQEQNYRGAVLRQQINAETKEKINKLAKKHKSTEFMVMLSAFMLMLSKYSRQEDIIVGVPISGRTHADTHDMLGMFVNTLALRGEVRPDQKFDEFLEAVKEKCLKAYDNQEYQFEDLVEAVEVQREMSRNPIFDIMFEMQNRSELEIKLGNSKAEYIECESNISKFDITLSVANMESGYTTYFEYCTDLFKSETIELMAKHYVNLIENILKNPQNKLAELSMLDKAEEEQVLREFNDTYVEYSKDRTVSQLFEEQVEKTPDNIAVVFENNQLTYAELNSKANSLAVKLRAVYGVGPDDFVAMVTERSLEMIIGIFAIIKAGGAYVPIDPTYPEERIQYMLKDSAPKALLTYKAEVNTSIPVIDLADGALWKRFLENPKHINNATDLLYMIYTSGTTGQPKGVMIEHKGINNLKNHFINGLGICSSLTVGMFHNYVFDGSVCDIMMGLLTGSRLIVLNENQIFDISELKEIIKKEKIDIITLPPQYALQTNFKGIKLLMTGGSEAAGELLKNVEDIYVNAYGPTENTIDAVFWKYQKGQPYPVKIPIGKPLSNVNIYILNGSELCGIGVPGELYIAGDGLARGYFNRPELTKEKFIKNTYGEGKMYRSGDLARWLPDGNIEYLGRIDEQVKVRGFRIELGEVENKILEIEGINEVTVIAREDKSKDNYLCAYITSNEEIDSNTVKEELRKSLPDYMVPAYIKQITTIPVRSNGKLDKKALPEPEYININEYVPPRNNIEKVLVKSFQDILGVERVSVTDNFFDLGGDSIKAIRVVSKVREAGYSTNVKVIMSAKTPENIVRETKEQLTVIKEEQGEINGEVQLTAIQKDFFGENLSNPNYYNQSAIFECKVRIDMLALNSVLSKLCEHHDILRATYKDGIQSIGRVSDSQWYNLSEYECRTDEIDELAKKLQGSIDIEKGPLMKVGVFRTPEMNYVLLIIHHLVVDGVSWRIISEDLESGYKQAKQNKIIVLPEKTTSFKKWSSVIAEYRNSYKLKREIDYWNKINMEIEKGKVINDGEKQRSQLNTAGLFLGNDHTEILMKNSNKAYNTEINDLLLTALARAVYKVTGQRILAVEMEGHGREEISEKVNADRTVGWFTSVYPVVLKDVGKDIEQDIRNTKETLRRIPNKGIGYAILKDIGECGLEKISKPDITFNYLGEFGSEQASVDTIFAMSNVAHGQDIDTFNMQGTSISINGGVKSGELSFEISYDEGKYTPKTVDKLCDKFKQELISVAEHCNNLEFTECTASDYGESEWTDEEFKAAKDKLESKGGEIKRIYPLTAMQEGMLFEKRVNEYGTQYVVQQTIRFNNLNPKNMFSAFEALVSKHDILHTVIKYKGVTVPRQVLLNERKPEFTYIEAANEDEYEKIKVRDIKRGFDLEDDTLIRMIIVKLSDNDYRMIQTSHHIISDGWCVSIMYGELFRYYKLLEAGSVIPKEDGGNFEKFVRYIEMKNKEESLCYWKKILEDYEERADILPMGTTSVIAEESQKRGLFISKEITQKAEKLSIEYGVTMNTLVEAVWGILLQKYNRTNDVVFGKVVSGRNAEVENIEQMVGLFINTIPVRIKTEPNETLKTLVGKLQKQAFASDEHDYCSLAEIQSNSLLGNSLIGTIMAFENYYIQDEEIVVEDSLGVTEFESSREQTNYGISLSAYMSETLNIGIEYDTSKYREEEIELLLNHMKVLMENAINNPEAEIENLDMSGNKEEDKLLWEFNDTSVSYPKEKTIVELFEEQVEKTSNKVAVVYGDECLTYDQLNSRANSVAAILRNDYSVGPGDFVAIITERSIEMIVGIFAVLKAGGAYVPIDPTYPEERIQYILGDSSPKAVLTYRAKVKTNISMIDLADRDVLEDKSRNLERINKPMDPIYVIYTSGTTGKPKGVVVENTNLVSLVKNDKFQFDFNGNDVWTLFHSHCFDFSVWEIFCSLLYGGKLIVVPKATAEDTFAFVKLIEKEKVTVLNQVPSSFYNLMTLTENKTIKSIRYVIFGGEALNPGKLKLWHENNKQSRLINMYGITETTVHVTYSEIDEEVILKGISIIGSAIPTLSVYILNRDNLCPIGVPGELCVTGDGVTRGYLNKPELTAEKFVKNPYGEGRMYRSGDLARWLPDGNIEYLGRIDEQVKIRGFRIELGEIESAILAINYIKDAVVITKKMDGGDRELNAYVVSDERIDTSKIQKVIRKNLPEYMIPGYMMQIDTIPVTQNGKLNRKELPDITKVNTNGYIAPRTEMEKIIVEIFEDVLGINNVGVNNNFFEIGGHSLKAAYIINKIESVMGVHLTLRSFFENPTVEGICEIIGKQSNESYTPIKKAELREYYPMSSAQERIFVINDMDTNGITYNLQAEIIFDNCIDIEKLRKAFSELASRHEAIRTSFHLIDGQPVQKIENEVITDIEYHCSNSIADDIKNNVLIGFVKPFDLSKAPLMRLKLIDTTDNRSILLFDVHHIITDGISQNILIRELSALYNDECLPANRVQYKDYSEWMRARDLSKQRQYWIDQFSDEPSTMDIPLDYTRPKIQSFKGKTITLQIEAEVVEKVRALSAKKNMTEYMILLSISLLLLNKYSGQTEIVIGTPISGRTHRDTENIIGMFVNTLALRCHITSDELFTEFLEDIKQICLEAYDNQEYPFEKLVEDVDVARDVARNPLFDVMFAMRKKEQEDSYFGNHDYQLIELESEIAKFDITIEVIENEKGYELQFEYSTDIFKEETICSMMDNFDLILKQALSAEDTKISQLTGLITDNDKQQIMHTFNCTKTKYPSDKTVVELFEEQVEKNPNNTAVVYGNEKLSYKELNAKANALACKLKDLGINHGDFVAIIAERSIQVIIGIIGTIKAGAAYVPIDPQYPQERIDYILKDCNPKATLIYDVDVNAENTVIDLSDHTVFEGEVSNHLRVSTPRDLAYVIYTSGTTGKPKGVMIENKNILRLIKNTNYVELNEETIILQTGAISFDASTFEIWGALLNGGMLFLAHKYTLQSPEEMRNIIRENGVNTLFLTTALFNQMISFDSGFFSSVNYLMFGGEKTSEQYVSAFRSNPANKNVIFSNVYGPTEATTFSLFFQIQSNHSGKTPIGKPISNSEAYIINNNGLCSIGQKGELCLTGDGIARGYLNNDDLTALKFINNPFGAGKLYRSGDIARWLPDGNIEFLGRMDDQVKIRGFRIELGEIESVIRDINYIKDIVVIVGEAINGDKELSAYIVSDEEVDAKRIQIEIRKKLPEYMVPSHIMQIEKIPLNRNGKLDRKALPNIEITSSNEYIAPITEKEKMVCKIFADILGVSNVGLADNLYELGGDSIKAIRIVSKLREKGFVISMKDLLCLDDVGALSSYLSQGDVNLSYEQEKIYGRVKDTPAICEFKSFNLKEPQHFHQSIMLVSREDIDRLALEKALTEITNHHDILRAVYKENTIIIRSNNNGRMFELYESDLTGKDKIADFCTQLQASFDLKSGPMLKACIIRVNSVQYLFICIHHLVVDTMSWRILLEDLMNAYMCYLNNQVVALPQKTISFIEWSKYLEDYAMSTDINSKIDYWMNIVDNAQSAQLNLGEVKNNQGGTISMVLDSRQTADLLYNTRKAFNTEVRDILISALAIAIKKWKDVDKAVVMLEGHGRQELHKPIRNDRTVGWFTSIYPIIIQACNNTQDTVVTAKEMLRSIPNAGIDYGIIKCLTDTTMKDVNSAITWNYHGLVDENTIENSVMHPVTDIDTGITVAKSNKYLTPIIIELMVSGGELNMDFIYQEIISESEVINFAELYKQTIIEHINYCRNNANGHKTLSDFELRNIEILDADEINKLAEGFN